MIDAKSTEYDSFLDRSRTRFREKSRDAREISEDIPEIVKPRRRKKALRSFLEFCKKYVVKPNFRPFNKMQLEIIEEFDRVIKTNSKKALGAYRRGGKSTISRGAILYAALTKHPYIMYLGASRDAITRTKDAIYNEIMYNETLYEDFPEVVYPFRRLNGVRNSELFHKGKPVNAKVSASEIVFPTIEGSLFSGHRIDFRSYNAASLLGSDTILRGKGAVRPSLVIIDDVESDESAASEVRNKNMIAKLKSTIEHLSGYDNKGRIRKMAIIVIGTVKHSNDFMSQLLDPEQNPDFCGSVYKRVYTMPTNMHLWREYREVRRKSLLQFKDIRLAREFYEMNREAMDEGCEVNDNDDFDEDTISGIHYSMDHWAKDEPSFWTEMQNDPDAARYSSGGYLSPPHVWEKSVDIPQYHVPPEAVAMTAHIDVGKHLLWWCVTAWGESVKFGHVVDYGVYPQQPVSFIRKESPIVSIQNYCEVGDEFEKVHQAIRDVIEIIFEQQYFLDSQEINIHELTGLKHYGNKKPFSFLSICGVDCSDGNYETMIWSAINESKYRDRVMPMYGDVAKARLMRYYRLKEDSDIRYAEKRRAGCDWILNPDGRRDFFSKMAVRHCLKYDVNMFKSQVNSALLAPVNKDGTITIYQDGKEKHKMFSHQMCAEEYTVGNIGTNKYDRWKMKKPEVADNDLFDALVATAALRDFIGIENNSKNIIKRRSRDVVR